MNSSSAQPWTALRAATLTTTARLPFCIGGRCVGSVAVDHVAALAPFGDVLHIGDESVDLQAVVGDRVAAFRQVNDALRTQGLILAWRDETYAVVDPSTREILAHFERAASRFWGTLTFGAHATGYVAGADGRPAQLWIAQRAYTKATDPGLYDNLIGGGVPAGQTPAQTLEREGYEEAGLTPAQMAAARPAGVLRVARDIAEGYQHEWLYSYDLELPPGTVPANQDGEVHAFTLMAVDDAVALAAGDAMTVDAAVVTIDFAARHGLLPPAQHAAVSAVLQTLRLPDDVR